MVVALCDQTQSVLVNALIIACLAVAVILVLVMVSRGCGHPKGGGSFRGEKMVGAHWVQAGTYGNTADTCPAYGLSGYYDMVPTPPWA